MPCPKCESETAAEDDRCQHCGGSLAIAVLEVIRGDVAERLHLLRPRHYNIGRARHNDIVLSEPSVSKSHVRLTFDGEHFSIEDQGSLHGVYVNAERIRQAELGPGAEIQLGNLTLRFSPLNESSSTDTSAVLPWVEQQQLLLSVVQALNSTLVLNDVLEQVLDAVMLITRAERGFLLLSDDPALGASRAPVESVAGLAVRVARGKGVKGPTHSLSTSVVRRAMATRSTVAIANAQADPRISTSESIVALDLRTIVCVPLRSPRATEGEGPADPIGVLYFDNQESSAPFAAESLRAAEALARHAALAIENARLFEGQQRSFDELRQTQTQLLQSEKLATIGQMAAGITHEMKTPLTYIIGSLDLLETENGLSPASSELTAAIRMGAERLASLAHSMRTFSRPSLEELQRLDFKTVVEHSLELCRYQVLKSGVRLERIYADGLPEVLGAAAQLEMAVINLVVNAIHALKGHRGGELRIQTEAGVDEVLLSVSDNGPGIPEAVRDRVFEPFVTTKGEGEGTGLGLSTVLMVVERHGGRIDYSTSPAGTTFKVALPAAPAAP
jgi:signal transduction histidine kinase